MMHPRSILLLLSLTLCCNIALAQPHYRPLIQFSGVVVTGDSLAAVPFTNVLVKNSYRGTMSDVFGYFSFVAQEGDTILFSAVGFKRSQFVMPESLTESKYSIIHQMESDTVLLKEFTVYPWPSRDQFREAFLALDLPDDDYQHSLKNLSPAEMMQRMENLPPDAYQSFNYAMEQDRTRLYNSGGVPSINLFNPIAWAQFIQAWKNGDFKKKK
ncbi:MAG: carboxypeptidase-like regulatory domain-containing protein [Flavobacteriales bacterium]